MDVSPCRRHIDEGKGRVKSLLFVGTRNRERVMEANSIGHPDHVHQHQERPQTLNTSAASSSTPIQNSNQSRISNNSKGPRKSDRKKMAKKRCVCCQGPKNDLQDKADSQQKRCNQLLERICALQLNILNNHLVKQYDSFLDHIDPNGGLPSPQVTATATATNSIGQVGGVNSNGDTVTANDTESKDVPKSSPARPGPSGVAGGLLYRNEDVKLGENGLESTKDSLLSYDGPGNQSDLIVLQKMLEKCESTAATSTPGSYGNENEGGRRDPNGFAKDSSLLEGLLREKTKEQKEIEAIKSRIQQTRKTLSAAAAESNVVVPSGRNCGGGSSVLNNVISTSTTPAGLSSPRKKEDARLKNMLDAYNDTVAYETDWLSVSMNQSIRETMRPSQTWDETDSSCGDESCDEEFMPRATESNTTKFPYLPT